MVGPEIIFNPLNVQACLIACVINWIFLGIVSLFCKIAEKTPMVIALRQSKTAKLVALPFQILGVCSCLVVPFLAIGLIFAAQ